MRIYRKIVNAKNNSLIPLFQNGHAAHSKYNPENEAENFIKTVERANFFLIAGIAGAYAISSLHKKFPESVILAVDANDDDITFLKTIPNVSHLANEKNILFSSIENFPRALKENYFPSIHGDLRVIVIASWKTEARKSFDEFQKKFKSVKNEIANDFATQARFGKIWQKNILENLRIPIGDFAFSFPTEKIACIVAAGPSLDKTIYEIKKKSDIFFIIATDTAYGTLRKEKIFCDCVVSIDGQTISSEHFFGEHNPKTLFVFDLQANPSAVRTVDKNPLLFIETGHPLSLFAKRMHCAAPHIESFGTVTLAAIDFAHKAGFQNFAIFGADFSFEKKAYARGTYFDSSFAKESTKFTPIETRFCALMYGSVLQKLSNGKTTTIILQNYKNAFDAFLKMNCDFIKNEGGITRVHFIDQFFFENKKSNFIFSDFAKKLISDCKTAIEKHDFQSPAIFCLFPLLAFLSKNKNFNRLSPRERINLAFKNILRYTWFHD